MKILKQSHSKEIKEKEVNLLVLKYLEERGMRHSAFCFKHEAEIARKAQVKEGKLFSLVKKGLILEDLEKESQEVLRKLDKEVRDYAVLNGGESVSREEETLKKEISLKEYISTKISWELNRMMEGSLSNMRNSRTTFSSCFSGARDDLLPMSVGFHEPSLRRLEDKEEGQMNLPDIAFRTGNFTKKKAKDIRNKCTLTKQPRRSQKQMKNSSMNIKKQMSQSQIDFDKYNSKFSFAPIEEAQKLKDFMFKTHQGRFNHTRSKSLAYSFDGTSDKQANNLTSFDTLANLETSFFQKTETSGFRCQDFRSHKHFLMSCDSGFRKLAILNMDRRLRGLEEGSGSTRPQVFKISEELRSKSPRIVFDSFAIFYTQNEFIVFDYQ